MKELLHVMHLVQRLAHMNCSINQAITFTMTLSYPFTFTMTLSHPFSEILQQISVTLYSEKVEEEVGYFDLNFKREIS